MKHYITPTILLLFAGAAWAQAPDATVPQVNLNTWILGAIGAFMAGVGAWALKYMKQKAEQEQALREFVRSIIDTNQMTMDKMLDRFDDAIKEIRADDGDKRHRNQEINTQVLNGLYMKVDQGFEITTKALKAVELSLTALSTEINHCKSHGQK